MEPNDYARKFLTDARIALARAENANEPDAFRAASAAIATAYANLAGLALVCPELFAPKPPVPPDPNLCYNATCSKHYGGPSDWDCQATRRA
jgi:hypothetical protein